MLYAYKINSDYSGFTPPRLMDRLDGRGRIPLGWRQYIDAVEPGDTVFVFFTGRRVTPGIYCRAKVVEVNERHPSGPQVWLRMEQVDLAAPIADGATTRRIVHLISRSTRQVFAVPEESSTECSAFEPGAPSCASHECDACPLWRRLPRVLPGESGRPDRLTDSVKALASGVWTVPPRSFLEDQPRRVVAGARTATDLLRLFKAGESGLAYTLAAAAHEALLDEIVPRVSALVPIPLSPEKVDAKELHRAHALAVQLSLLVRAPVRQALSLASPVGKRAMLREQRSIQDFETAYREALVVDPMMLKSATTILLVDDVCTRGSTLSIAAEALISRYPRVQVYAAVGAQMAIKASASQASNLVENDLANVSPSSGTGRPSAAIDKAQVRRMPGTGQRSTAAGEIQPRPKPQRDRTVAMSGSSGPRTREFAGWKVNGEWHAEVRCSCGGIFVAASIRQAVALHNNHKC